MCYNREVKKPAQTDNLLVWQTAGQNGAKHLLNNFLLAESIDNIPHAFLFLGPSGVGKYSLTKEFAQKISQLSGDLSEILEFDFADSGSVDNLRELIGLSSLTTTAGARKIFILQNFEQANLTSVNVLLKTLEEPPASSMFLLVANANRVLPTVMSRVIAIRCFPVTGLALNASLPKTLAKIVEQYPELAKQLESKPERAAKLDELLQKLQNHQLGLIDLNVINELEAEDLELLIMLWTHFLKQNIDDSQNIQTVINNLKIAQRTNSDLKRSYNTKLVLQQFLIQTK